MTEADKHTIHAAVSDVINHLYEIETNTTSPIVLHKALQARRRLQLVRATVEAAESRP